MPAIAASAAVVMGVAVLLGWILDISSLRTFLPGITNPMVASSAVCFILGGTSLWLLRHEDRSRARLWLGRGLAVGVATVGLLKLGEYVFGWELGIDQTLFVEDAGPFPGQMAVPTAVTFVLIGLGLAGLDVEIRRGARPAQVVLLLALLLPILGLLGRLYGVPTLSSLVAGTVVMALHTSITFLILCVGGLAARPSRGLMPLIRSDGPAGLLLRRLLPSTILVVAVAGWVRLQGQRLGLYGTELGAALMVILTLVLISVLVWRSATSLHRTDALRRAADERARESERRITQLLDRLPVGVFVIDAEGRPVYANRASERLLGKGIRPDATPDRLAETYQAFIAGTDQPYPTERMPIVRALAGERTIVDDTEIRRPDGPLRLEVEGTPIRDTTGRIQYAMAVFTNITERRRAQEELHRASEEAERANRAKSEFLSRMSHELRTPLNAILGFGQLMEMDDLDPEHEQSLTQILKAGRHLVDLIDEVLDISRIEAGRLSLSLEPVALDETANECLELLGPSADQRALALKWDSAAAAGRYVLADRQRLKQVLLNLLSNAVKYNRPQGEVEVSIHEEDGRTRVEVADTGPGIPAEERSRLFVPFERLGQTEVEGTGLGLALSKGLMEAMGGSIGMESRDGAGSVFWVELLEAQAPAAPVSDHEEPHPSVTADRPRTVLYIEDNPVNLRLVEKVLARRPGTRLLSAMQGTLGLELAREHLPDLILLDAHLPDMPGEEVLRGLRQDPATRHVPVVVVSADAMADRVQGFLRAGARAYLTKPIDVQRLLRLVAEIGDGKGSASSS